jgi:hypothetical protein
MAIAICGFVTLKDYLTLCPSTQCNYSQGYGHPTVKCPAQKENSPQTCAVCAERYVTELHACTIGNCKQDASAHTLR